MKGEQDLSRKEREFIEAQRAKRELERKTALGMVAQCITSRNTLLDSL